MTATATTTTTPRPSAPSPSGGGKFVWDDPFLLVDQLTEDERMILETARGYAQEKLLPRVLKAYA